MRFGYSIGSGQFALLISGGGAEQVYLGSEHYGHFYQGDGYALISKGFFARLEQAYLK
ncbi:MAG TPA: hypothetical protein V6C84_28790 [Coleofasciculaceae cyanobacterium]|jgi:hypothetical protein